MEREREREREHLKIRDFSSIKGDDCENDTDACTQNPCPLGRNCTDLTPQEEVALGRGYNCTDCPAGFQDIDNKCEGKRDHSRFKSPKSDAR